jgi:DNA-binding response OmpR family regulator
MSKILIIEDEPDAAKVLMKRLAHSGYRVKIAIDGYQGVKMANDERPDLIILDLMLPAGGGLSVLKNIRLSARNRFTPVLVLTGMDDENYKQQILSAGVEGYMKKPYNAAELLATVEKLINKANPKN